MNHTHEPCVKERYTLPFSISSSMWDSCDGPETLVSCLEWSSRVLAKDQSTSFPFSSFWHVTKRRNTGQADTQSAPTRQGGYMKGKRLLGCYPNSLFIAPKTENVPWEDVCLERMCTSTHTHTHTHPSILAIPLKKYHLCSHHTIMYSVFISAWYTSQVHFAPKGKWDGCRYSNKYTYWV